MPFKTELRTKFCGQSRIPKKKSQIFCCAYLQLIVLLFVSPDTVAALTRKLWRRKEER